MQNKFKAAEQPQAEQIRQPGPKTTEVGSSMGLRSYSLKTAAAQEVVEVSTRGVTTPLVTRCLSVRQSGQEVHGAPTVNAIRAHTLLGVSFLCGRLIVRAGGYRELYSTKVDGSA